MVSYEDDGNKFNFRVNAIIYNNDKTKILIHQIDGYNFWLLPGGRLELLEDTKSAIIRELREELGLYFQIEKLYSVNETFFNLSNKKYHEIGFFYIVKPVKSDYDNFNNICQKSKFTGIEGEKYIFKWIKLKDLKKVNFKPSCIIDDIVACNHNVCKHYIIDEL